jgi:hypothetical protein
VRSRWQTCVKQWQETSTLIQGGESAEAGTGSIHLNQSWTMLKMHWGQHRVAWNPNFDGKAVVMQC